VISSVAVGLALALGMTAPQLPLAGRIEPVAGYPQAVPAAQLMSEIVTRTNILRHKHGCGQLAVDHDLIKASVRQSYFMAETGRFSHYGPDRSTFVNRAHAAGYAQPAAENIAWGYPDTDAVMDAWMASPGHRAHILDCRVKSVGTGVVYALNGLPYYTEVFGWE
jgi:uncharacterized protein YkwD